MFTPRFKKLENSYFDASKKLHAACKRFIIKKLKENDGNVSFEDAIDGCFVTYNGGRHPEYASGYQSVRGISLQGKNALVELEDGDEYLDEFSTDDIYEIASVLDATLEFESTIES